MYNFCVISGSRMMCCFTLICRRLEIMSVTPWHYTSLDLCLRLVFRSSVLWCAYCTLLEIRMEWISSEELLCWATPRLAAVYCTWLHRTIEYLFSMIIVLWCCTVRLLHLNYISIHSSYHYAGSILGGKRKATVWCLSICLSVSPRFLVAPLAQCEAQLK